MLQRRVLTSARRLRAVTGFSRDEFQRFLPSFAVAYHDAAARERGNRPRQRRVGGGRKGQLSALVDKLLFILVYVHLYPIQEVQGVLFSLGQSQASDWAIHLLPVLQAALGKEVALPARPPASMEALCTQCPDLTFLLDATERPIQRPGNDARQRQHYSGKKKRHTVKNTVVTDRKGRRIVYLGATVRGSTHDKTQAEADALPFPPDSQGAADLGYQGYSPPNLRLTIPLKKPKGGELADEEKAANTALAKLRIYVEHAIRGIKRQRIAADIFRNTSAGLIDLSIEVAAGVYNLTNQYRGRYTPSVN
ncbi:MAG: transposase family protein [Armatimonadota bacterium]